ncbi:pentapeptide repeat-containing protein, partial [Qaidamihabitans albus]|uniref:pentapeptide repeat-containing protein n=1 Tax=Qaidamihabitans albus TaxID=2795733 RepID=UPI0035580021
MFDGARFDREAQFGGASFAGITMFDRVRFDGDARFERASFGGTHTVFDGASFAKQALFSQATFASTMWFGAATFLRKPVLSTAWARADKGRHSWLAGWEVTDEPPTAL